MPFPLLNHKNQSLESDTPEALTTVSNTASFNFHLSWEKSDIAHLMLTLGRQHTTRN